MTNNFIQKGDIVDYKNGGESAINYGDIVVGTDKIFIAAENIAIGATGGVHAEGVFELTTSDTSAITFGEKMYYDATNDGVTADATVTTGTGNDAVTTNNIFVGYAVNDVASSASGTKKVLVKLA